MSLPRDPIAKAIALRVSATLRFAQDDTRDEAFVMFYLK